MIFADADYTVALFFHDQICVTIAIPRRKHFRCAIAALAIEMLVFEVAKINDSPMNCECATAIFVHASADVIFWWCAFGDGPIRCPSHNHTAPTLQRT